MLYLIGGPTRTGKSLLAQKLISAKPMPCLSVDWVRKILFDVSEPIRQMAELGGQQRSRALGKPISTLARTYSQFSPDTLIEGDDLLPLKLARTCKKYQINVRAVFLGYSVVDQDLLLQHEHKSHHQWLHLLEDHEINQLTRSIVRMSTRLERDCGRVGFKFIDMAHGSFNVRQKEALNVLLKSRPMTIKNHSAFSGSFG